MANRDLFIRERDSENWPKREVSGVSRVFGRIFWQGFLAFAIFCGIVAVYEQESALGEGVRYVVALAAADQQEVLAVGSFSDLIGKMVTEVGGAGEISAVNGDNVGSNGSNGNGSGLSDESGGVKSGLESGVESGSGSGSDRIAGVVAVEGEPVLILPTSGMMEAAFGDVGADGIRVNGLKIYCQGEQQVRAAAAGRVTEVLAGESVLLEHSGGIESCYLGEITPAVAVGDEVRQGEAIGSVEEGELLFQVLCEGEAVDPFLYLLGPE